MMIQWLGFEWEWARRMAIIGARDDTTFLQRAIRQWQLMVEHINDCCGSWAVALWAWWSTDELSIDACGSTTPALAGLGTNWVYSGFLASIYTNSFSRAPLVSRSGAIFSRLNIGFLFIKNVSTNDQLKVPNLVILLCTNQYATGAIVHNYA